MTKSTTPEPVDTDVPKDTDLPADPDDSKDSEGSEDSDGSESTEGKRKRQPMPFGRAFGITVKFHNDMPDDRRAAITEAIVTTVTSLADGETLDTHRSSRGEPNENFQTWLIAPYGYDWPEPSNKERGVRIPQGALADALRKFAAKNDVSMEKAAEMFAAAFGIGTDDK